jgi:hypothetical protein
MLFRSARTLAGILSTTLIFCALAHAGCPVETIIVKGRVRHAPHNAKIRVQLIFAKEKPGDTSEATLENDTFSVPIEFLTQSRKPVLMGNLGEKCNRKPKTVVVTLMEGDHECELRSLDFSRDFQMADPSAFTVRSELVINGPQ